MSFKHTTIQLAKTRPIVTQSQPVLMAGAWPKGLGIDNLVIV